MQQRQLNPYAPTAIETALTGPSVNDFPDSGIQFVGHLDVNEVRKVDRVSLTIGLAIGLVFAGMLAVGAVSALSGGRITGARSAVTLMMAATAVTLLAVGVFAYSQTEKPIRKFPWMTGPIRGVVHPWRIDMQWNAAEASLLYSALVSEREFCNHSGRMFDGRGVLCFVPTDAVDPQSWTLLRTMPRRTAIDELEIALPPLPPARSITWHSPAEVFVDDLMRHGFVCSSPDISRPISFLSSVSLLCAVMLGGVVHEPAIVLACAAMAAVSVSHWMLQEGTRRNWRCRYSRPLRWFTKPSVPGKAPPFTRWMTDDDLLVGYKDAWIRMPWVAIRKAIVSQHAVELKLTSDGVESWYLERGAHGEDEWRSVRDQVLARVPNGEVWGSARN